MENTNILIIKFRDYISDDEVYFFRSAIIQKLENKSEVLFHNHLDKDKYRYSYPLIQYKKIKQKAAIVCIDKGTEVIGSFISQCDLDLQLGKRNLNMQIDSLIPYKIQIQQCSELANYHIHKWLPLNSDNYRKYLKMDGLTEKVTFLENILIGNLLSFTKGINVFLDFHIQCKITQINFPQLIINKDVKLMSFKIDFQSNIYIPEYIGIGKSTSIGYGIVTQHH